MHRPVSVELLRTRGPVVDRPGARGGAVRCLQRTACVAVLAFGAAAAPVGAQDATAAPPRCQQVSATVFMLDGPTDAAMRDCVVATLAPTTNELVVRSGGGNVEVALDIAERLQRPGLVVRVREKCYSSCANYFLPLAATLVVEPGATIVLHGGVDPQFIAEEHVGKRDQHLRHRRRLRPDLPPEQLAADFERSVEAFTALAQRQREFALRHGVGLGWFLYREPGDRDFGRHVAGRAGPRPSVFGWRYLLVEEPMLRSCLPRVRVQAFQAELESGFIRDRERYRRFEREKGRRSLDLQCTPAARAPS
ncbi:hypothetical protein [Lysobacter sp. N42]|uniref:hypothetical protein n=1 Tax=Lysobacter sp. N42 TaxID=2545719 RepID=UPI00104EAA9F|nr:hypothetical protein [Lysobacter sp. N42]TCZ78989.1 hypothetical protein EYQ95_25475 [Lysobacter sp. N42]